MSADSTPGLWQSDFGGVVLAHVTCWTWRHKPPYADKPETCEREHAEQLRVELTNGSKFVLNVASGDSFVRAMNLFHEVQIGVRAAK